MCVCVCVRACVRASVRARACVCVLSMKVSPSGLLPWLLLLKQRIIGDFSTLLHTTLYLSPLYIARAISQNVRECASHFCFVCLFLALFCCCCCISRYV